MAESALIADKGGALDALSGIVGFHIRLAHGAVYRHFTETFVELGLTQKQVSVLWLVDDQPGLSQVALGQMLQMDRATTMSIINRLGQRNLLNRTRSATDGRKQELWLTPEGAAVLQQAKSCIEAHENWLKRRFSPDEVKKLVELLQRIHD